MAKLNVKETNGVVKFEGKTYKKIEGPAKKGDLAKVIEPWGNQQAGAFYPVINEDHFLYDEGLESDFIFIDGEVRHSSKDLSSVEVYREIEAESTIKPGTKIRITKPYMAGSYYKEGDVLTVKYHDFGGNGTNEHVYAEGIGRVILRREFEVLTEPTLKVGDKVKLVIPEGSRPEYGWGDVSNGEIGEVVRVYGSSSDVDFPSQSGWTGANHEFELLDDSKPSEPKCKTVKRPAKAGERILIVDARPTFRQTHENGDVLVVIDANYTGYTGDVAVESQPSFIDYLEYEVIVEDAKKFEPGDIIMCRSRGIIGEVVEGPVGDFFGGNYHVKNGDEIDIILGDEGILLVKASGRVDKRK